MSVGERDRAVLDRDGADGDPRFGRGGRCLTGGCRSRLFYLWFLKFVSGCRACRPGFVHQVLQVEGAVFPDHDPGVDIVERNLVNCQAHRFQRTFYPVELQAFPFQQILFRNRVNAVERTHSATALEAADRFAVLERNIHIHRGVYRAADHKNIKRFGEVIFKVAYLQTSGRKVPLVAEREWRQ